MLIQFPVVFVQVAFTGSTEIGQKIMEAAAQTNLKVHLPAIEQPGQRMFAVD
jgi:acyl-CoA reductase-like NAD-dependent aldehyde dehydrogenase